MWRIFVFVAAFLIAGCAPRDNPYDPLSPYRFPSIRGRIVNLRGDTPLPNITVVVDSQFVDVSDAQGEFEIRLDVPGQHTINASGEDVMAFDTSITVEPGDDATLTIRMDQLPIIESVALNSIHIASTVYGEQYFLNVSCRAEDPDGEYEIDSVTAQVGTRVFMLERVEGDSFLKTLPESLLPHGTIHGMIGNPVTVEVIDIHGGKKRSLPVYLTRVISGVPIGVSPIGGHLTGPTPTLIWNEFDAGFPVSYEIELYTAPIGQPPALIEHATGLTDTTYTVADSLSPGYYYWVVFAVDNFGNKSRSVEYLFVVQSNGK